MLTTCREDDVSQTLYKDTLKLSKPEADAAAAAGVSTSVTNALPQKSKESKVNRICDAFVVALKSRLNTNLQNLITAHVCKKPPALEAGLRLVADLRGWSYAPRSNSAILMHVHSARARESGGSRRAYVLLDRCESVV